jgi:Heparinase II/III-like protein/Heparinase II/III N-terminus
VWKRALRMSPAELMDRGRQEISKRADTWLSQVGYDPSRIPSGPVAPDSGRFFFNPDSVDTVLALVRQRLPRQAEKIVSDADKILTHKFDLLGYESVDVGDPIDWHLDAVHRKRAPRKSFYKVRYLDFDECGDSKIIWELNRHQHLVTLAKAFRLSGERRYADEILRQWEHWHAENPYPRGINWASSLEVAFRSLAWFWMYNLLAGTGVLPAEFHRQWLQSQARNARHIERYLSTYFSANTHLLGEAVALFFVGVLCPQLPQAGRWKARGWQIVVEQSRRQVLPDGFHFEQSVYYHVYAVDLFLHSLILARLNGVEIPLDFEKTVEKMLDALFLLGRSGTLPSFGDDDGGRLFDPRRNQREHLLDPLATGGVLFRRPEFRELAGDVREETLWLLGTEAIGELQHFESPSRAARSAALQSAGYYVLTAGDSPSELVVDAGPQGAQNAGHGHADALSVCLQARGRALLIDPGTFEYVGAGSERDRFRGTAMHNTVCVDGKDQSEPAGPFGWKQLAHGKAERWIQGESFDWLIASHDGYGRIDPSIVHRRWILALKTGLFLVRDIVGGKGRHLVDISWHLGPGLRDCGDGVFRFEGDVEGLAVVTERGPRWTKKIRMDDWSPVYGKKLQAPVTQFSCVADLPVEFVTLLVPLPGTTGIPQDLSRVGTERVATERVATDNEGRVRAYRAASEAEEWQFFFADQGERWQCGRIASDARLVCWQRMQNAVKATLIMCEGSYIEVDAKRIVDCARAVERCEVVVQDGAVDVSCSDPSAMRSNAELAADILAR